MTPAFVPTPIIRHLDFSAGHDSQGVSETGRHHVLKDYRQEQVAMLVSDMSGFTKLTRAHGVVHFASIIARFRQLTYPSLHRYGAWAITVEGDSFNVVFPTAEAAVLAACEMQQLVRRNNAALPPEHAHFQITLDGIGVDFGIGPLLDRAGKFHGPTFENAHLLGEELCKGGQVVISQCVHDLSRDLPELVGVTFGLMLPEDEETQVSLSAMNAFYEVVTPPLQVQNTPLPGAHANDFLQAALLPLAGIHCHQISDGLRKQLETQFESMYLKPKVALMFDFCFQDAFTADTQLRLKFECLAVLGRVFRCFHVEPMEDVLYFLDDAVDAILLALACGKLMDKINQQCLAEGLPRILISGIGVHIGQVLYVPDTDIHWGDPVNTASKLSQELARDGEIYISKQTYAACEGDPRLHGLRFHQTCCMVSGVKFEPYRVEGKNMVGSIERLRFDGALIEEFLLYECDVAGVNAAVH